MSESQDNLEGNPDFVRAVNAFSLVIGLNPNHANARYSLALAYETLGKLDLALEQMGKVQELNPDNEQVKQKIQNLKTKISPAPAPEPEPEEGPEEGPEEE